MELVGVRVKISDIEFPNEEWNDLFEWYNEVDQEQVREDLLPPGNIEHEFQKNMNKQVIALLLMSHFHVTKH